MSYHPEPQCVRVNKVYDWINQITNIKLKEKIPIKKGKCLQDNICLKFNVPCDGTRSILWNGADVKDFIGTFAITIDRRCKGQIELFVNGNSMTTLTGGQSFSANITDLQLIEIECQNDPDVDNCKGTLDIQLVYTNKADEECKNINCFLSDHKGNPLSPKSKGSVCCIEQSDPINRQYTEIVLNGEIVTLQEVELLIKGFITVQLLNNEGKVCGWFVFPFWDVETFYLCAPTGTDIQCNVSEFHCKVEFVPHILNCKCCVNISIRISIHLSVSAFTDVTIELLGNECDPRPELQDFCVNKQVPDSCIRVKQNTS